MVYAQLKRFRTFIVDDSPLFLSWLESTLADTEDFEVVGQAATGAEAIAQALELEPNVLITDFFLPDMDGLEVAIALRSRLPALYVIITSTHSTEVYAALEVSTQTAPYLPKVDLTASSLRDLLSRAAEQ